LNSSDVLLYPTQADNLSLTCLNALACGLPVISSKVGGQPEAIRDGVNGFLCTPGDYQQFMERVAQLASDSELLKQLSRGARRTAIEEFDINNYVTNLIAYYRRLL
jgi:glycosyltransferase involved in cell wall biosynthesis